MAARSCVSAFSSEAQLRHLAVGFCASRARLPRRAALDALRMLYTRPVVSLSPRFSASATTSAAGIDGSKDLTNSLFAPNLGLLCLSEAMSALLGAGCLASKVRGPLPKLRSSVGAALGSVMRGVFLMGSEI